MCPASDAARSQAAGPYGSSGIRSTSMPRARSALSRSGSPDPASPTLRHTCPSTSSPRRQPHARPCLRSDGRSSVDPALGEQRPALGGGLVGERDNTQHWRLAREHPAEPGAGRHAFALGPAHHAAGGDDEKTWGRALAQGGGSAEPLLAAARVLHGREADPGGEVPTRSEALGWRRERLDGGGDQGPDPRHRHQPAGDAVRLGSGSDLVIEFGDLALQAPQYLDKAHQAGACRLRDAGSRILDLSDQPLDMRWPLRRDQAVLAEMSTQGVDDLGALADKEVTRPEDHGRSLLRLTLHGHKAHGRTLGGFADRLGIGHVGLLALDERLHVGWRDQPHLVAELADRPTPMMRARAGLHGDEAAGLACQEGQHLLAPEPLAEHDGAGRARAVRLEHVLGQVQADGANLFHGRLPPVVLNTTTLARRCRRGASTWGNRGSESPHRPDGVGAGVEPTAALPIMMVPRGRCAIARPWAPGTGGRRWLSMSGWTCR